MSPSEWSFANDPLNGFKNQHDVRVLANGHILLFDNGDGSNGRPSRAVEYAIDEKRKVATLIWEYRSPEKESFREFMGSVQRLSNGNTLIGWGTPRKENVIMKNQPLLIFSEIDPTGNVVREMSSNDSLISGRVYFEETQAN